MPYTKALAEMDELTRAAATDPAAPAADEQSSQVAHILTDDERERVRRGHDPQSVYDLMVNTIPRLYAPARPYLQAITETFYGVERPQTDESPDGKSLSVQDRERVITSLLVLRNEELALATHIYISVAVGIAEEEIANIVLLAGLYGGVNTIVNGMSVLTKTLHGLKAAAAESEAPRVGEVMACLRTAFEGSGSR